MRRQLIGLVAAAMSLLLIALLVPLVVLIVRDAERSSTDTAVRRGQELAASEQVRAGAAFPESLDPGTGVSALFVDGRSTGVPVDPGLAEQLRRDCPSSTTRTADGLEVLVPMVGSEGCIGVVRLVASADALRAGLAPTLVMLLLVASGSMLAGVLLADRLGTGLLRSVTELAGMADRIAAGDLTARASPSGPPEMRRIGGELNRLAVRVGHLIAGERRRGADLTHRLRTPLTALRLDIDGLAHRDVDRDVAQRLADDVAAMTAAVDDVILASRRVPPEPGGAVADLARVVRQRAAFWAPLAEDTERDMRVLVGAAPLPVPAAAAVLEATLDALLGNVFAHTPAGSGLIVTATGVAGGGAVLIVDDAGPGLPDGGVVQRGRSGGLSTGLGLDIARRCAEESGGALRLGRSPMGGAQVRLRFGPAPGSPDQPPRRAPAP